MFAKINIIGTVNMKRINHGTPDTANQSSVYLVYIWGCHFVPNSYEPQHDKSDIMTSIEDSDQPGHQRLPYVPYG